GLWGADVKEAARALASCGASRFLAVEGDEFADARYASDAVAAETLARAAGATIIVAPAISRVSRVLGGVAHRLGGRADNHAATLQVAADGGLQLTRWYYRQRIMVVLERAHRPWLIAVESGAALPWTGAAGDVKIESLAVALSDADKRTRFEGIQQPPTDQQTIRPDAELLFVAGAGWTKKQRDGQIHVEEADRIIREFLTKSGASLGGTKSIVDQAGEGGAVLSCMSHMNQVGQTGSTPRHPKGLATCCHGEEPHVVGWRFINERRAVNLDPNCGWAHGKADVLYVADAFEVMRKVNELLG
ncbi:MAG: electron transfer flavoprotein subunit alpha/FixB family protein, partial [Candidatus Sumerlaeaceae bacterium]